MKIKYLLGGGNREVVVVYIGVERRSIRKEIADSVGSFCHTGFGPV